MFEGRGNAACAESEFYKANLSYIDKVLHDPKSKEQLDVLW